MPQDSDNHRLPDPFWETNNLDPDNEFSASEDTPFVGFLDNEIYAAGPIEEAAISNADTSEDWANPGSNFGSERNDE
ncbi:MAG: hypothetical protein AAGJ81_04190 [Verrucomicrobiota bacterium]